LADEAAAVLVIYVFAQCQQTKVVFHNVLANLSVVVRQGGQHLSERELQCGGHDACESVKLKHRVPVVGLLLEPGLVCCQVARSCAF
jgi:hypothetical protein